MASPVDTSVKWFRSSMAGAPILAGQAGKLVAILDACLVNGWGSQTASTCVVSGGVCTMTFPADHAAMQESVILVAGSSIADLNGEQKVTATAPLTVKFATASPDGTASGPITVKIAPAGWAKPFASGTTVGVYKSLNVQANGQFLRVNDAAGDSARVIGYETMTGVSSGTLMFPTSTQLNGGIYWCKSVAAGSVAVDWTIVADGRSFYFLPSAFMGADQAGSYLNYKAPSGNYFGDTSNLGKAADPFNTLLIGSASLNANYSGTQYHFNSQTLELHYLPKISAGTGTAQGAHLVLMGAWQEQDVGWDRHTGQIRLSEIVVQTANTLSWRAKMPGLAVGLQSNMELSMPWQSIVAMGTPEKKYLAMLSPNNISELSGLHLITFDLTGPWR